MLTPEQMKAALDEWIKKISPSKDRPVLSPEQSQLLKDKLGYPGRMLSGSKQTPKSKYGEHLAVFNANLIIDDYGKQWFGDIDITRDEVKLGDIARFFGKQVYVLRERDARFEHENNPLLDQAVYLTDGTDGFILNPDYKGKYDRAADGKLYRKPRV